MADQTVSYDRMRNAWGDDAPDWVDALARRCDELSQGRVGKLIGYSGATVSLVLNRAYSGDIKTVERAVRGALMNEMVECPVLGTIPTNECLAHQKRPFSTANRLRIRLYKACRENCPNSRLVTKEKNDVV